MCHELCLCYAPASESLDQIVVQKVHPEGASPCGFETNPTCEEIPIFRWKSSSVICLVQYTWHMRDWVFKCQFWTPGSNRDWVLVTPCDPRCSIAFPMHLRCGTKLLKRSQVYPKGYGEKVAKFHLKHKVSRLQIHALRCQFEKSLEQILNWIAGMFDPHLDHAIPNSGREPGWATRFPLHQQQGAAEYQASPLPGTTILRTVCEISVTGI